MKIAFLMLAHKNPKQVKLFLDKIRNDVYVHIDKKKDINEFIVEKDNIKYLKERVDIRWGRYSMVEASLKLINEAYSIKKYDYYILISGDDYFIKSENELERFLSRNKDKSFLEFYEFDDYFKSHKYRYEKYYLFENYNVFKKIIQKIINICLPKRNKFDNMRFYKGSQWWCLNNESIEYILEYLKENIKCIKFFKRTWIPDEMMFQTILLNSKLNGKFINNNLRFIKLGDRTHPEILTVDDYDELIKSKKCYLARKFDYEVDSEILHMLDKEV